MVLKWENAYGKAYTIQVSNDETNWTTAYTQTNGAGGTETLTFPTVTGRYIRMYGTVRGTVWGYSLYEFQVFAPAAGASANSTKASSASTLSSTASTSSSSTPSVAATSSATSVAAVAASTNLALGKTTKTSGSENAGYLGSANAVDGDVNSRWGSLFVDPSWIEVDLGSAQAINHVVLRWEAAYGVKYQIQVSNDEQNWTTAYTQAAGKGGVEDFTFNAVTGRYVRMYGTQRATGYGYSLYEFEVYGSATTGTAPTISAQPANATVAVGATATFTVTATGSGDTYQWRKGGSNISGATAASYTTPATVSGDNGSLFSVVVSNASGSVTSANASLTVSAGGGSTTPPYTVYPGFVGTDLQNNTKGAYRDDQIYVTVLGRDPATGVFSWLKPDGTLTHAAVADNTGPGHLVKNGDSYPNYAFTLAQSKLMKLPKMDSGRVFISLGEPVYLKVLSDINGQIGYAGPNPLNGTDPNIAVDFDWYEFTYNTTGLWINTTQVDEFGLPLLLDVYGASQAFHAQTGMTETVAAIFDEYVKETPAEFHTPTPVLPRIMAPGKSTFDVGQTNGLYFDAYVNQIWAYYTTNTLTVDMWGGSRRFAGKVSGNTLVFTEVNLGNGAYQGGTYNVGKPTTQDILEGKGTLATGNSVELALEAQICAAFNRHIMQDSSKWTTPSAWYQAAPANYYAKFWHAHSVGGLAYGFAYDDVSDQSSTIMSPSPEHMVFGIGY